MKNKSELPIIGRTYSYFDDGKINHSRRMNVTITDIIPREDIDIDILNEYLSEVELCDWLYSKETDYFIKGDLEITNNKIEKIVFVRTIDNNWFSLGDWGGGSP